MGKRKYRKRDSSSDSARTSSSADSNVTGRYKRRNRHSRRMEHHPTVKSVVVDATRHIRNEETPRTSRGLTPDRRSTEQAGTVDVTRSSSSVANISQTTMGQAEIVNVTRNSSPTVDTDKEKIRILEDLVTKLLEKDNRGPQVAVKADCIPEFNPGKPEMNCSRWLAKIEQLASINKWNEATMIYHMQTRLKGLAQTWYHNLDSYDYTWTQWKEILINAFPDHQDFPSAIKALLKRHKLVGESWTEYYFEKMQLLRQCEIIGKKCSSYDY